MISPRVTELPRNLEPVTDDPFTHDLDEPRRAAAPPEAPPQRERLRPPIS